MRAWPVLLLFVTALAGCQESSDDLDRDDDGLTDIEEAGGWQITVEYMDRRETRHVFSDPDDDDTDDDGLLDVVEFLNGLDPTLADTDGDGLTDCQETTDRDLDNCESGRFACEDGSCATGTDPKDADSDTLLSRYVVDTIGFAGELQGVGGDGISDGDELAGYQVSLNGITIDVRTDPRQIDSDNDGLHDAEERLRFGTHATNRDTDGDGCDDGNDIFPRQGPQHQDAYIRFLNLTLHDDADGDGQARIQVRTVVSSGLTRDDPPAPAAVAEGATYRFPAATRIDLQCPAGVQTHDPWVQLFFVVTDSDAEPARPLAIDGSSGVPNVWWNLHTNRFADAIGSDETRAGPLRFDGDDATLYVHPQITSDEPPVQGA